MAKTPLPLPTPVIEHHGQTVFDVMKEWRSSGHISPVLLLTGASGVGKREMAYFLAQWILCEQSGMNGSPSQAQESTLGDLFGGETTAPEAPSETPVSTQPCGKCASCHRALADTWVDFTEITPEEEETQTLKIEQFRRLKSTQGFGAHEGLHRIFLIANADRMTPQAANSMLKILEEPPTGWIFLLTASDPSLLLPTIVSRCQQLRLRPFATANLVELLALSGIPSDRRRICAELSHGSWGKAVQLAQEENWEKRKMIFAFLQAPATEMSTLVDWAASQHEHFNIVVDQLESACEDLIRWSIASTRPEEHPPETYQWINSDGKTALTQNAQRMTQAYGSQPGARDFWMERAARIARARVEAQAPINRKTLIQDILLPWLSPK